MISMTARSMMTTMANDLATSQTDTEDSILSSLPRESDKELHKSNDESDDESPEPTQLSTSEALTRIRELQSYFTKLENARQEDFLHLSSMEIFLLKQSSSLHQSSITDYFRPSSQQ